LTQREATTHGLSHGRLDRAEPLANPARESKGEVMRTLRLSLVGTVILVLLGGLAGVALAQDEPMEPALVTGTEICTGGAIETTQMEDYTLLHATGPEGHCTITASDPRVSGPSTEGDMWDACFLMGPDDPPFYPSGCIYWGDYGIEGPDGSWVGTWTGVDDPALGKASYLILLEGTGAYEGWSFVVHWLDPFTGAPLTFSGLIYEGPLPPWEPPEPPAE
jgi:hypothetical protein